MSVVPQTLIALVLWKDRIAAVARGLRAEAGGTRWALGRDYAAFLSHYKKEAAADARLMKDKLTDALGVPSFLDSDDLSDLRSLCDEVTKSDVLILFLTRDLLTRPWCLVELHAALTNDIPIVAVRVAGAFPYDFEDAQKFLDGE